MIIPIEKKENSQDIFQSLCPDLLVTMGGMVVSKKIKSVLRSYNSVLHYHIGTDRALDTYYLGVEHIEIEPNSFLRGMGSNFDTESSYQQQWLQLAKQKEIAHQKFCRKLPFSDLYVFDKIMRSIPKNYNIQWANSSPIRYAQLFAKAGASSYCNRGTSGIEGSISTAVGASVVSETPTLMIT